MFKPIQYTNEYDAIQARLMLDISGPQIQATFVDQKNQIQIYWMDGTLSPVTWPLFFAILDQREAAGRPLIK